MGAFDALPERLRSAVRNCANPKAISMQSLLAQVESGKSIDELCEAIALAGSPRKRLPSTSRS